MKFKKILAGIFSLALLTSGNMLNAFAATPKNLPKNLPENFAFYYGDMNQDFSVDIADIIFMQKYLLGLSPITKKMSLIGDINQDKEVNIYDWLMLKQDVLSGEWEMFLLPPEETQETTEPTEEITTETLQETTEPVETTTELTSTETTVPTEPTEEITSEPTEATTESFISSPVKEIDAGLPSQGNAKLIIFYVDFPDCQYNYSPTTEELQQIAFGAEDAKNANYPFESMTAFYDRSSKGAMHLQGTAFRYTAKENRSAYDSDKAKLLHECYEAFDGIIDFSQFDGDGDGKTDATLISVPKAAGDSDWWPCAGASGSERKFDNVGIGHFITGNAQIESKTDYKNFTSSYQHELGHCMGLPDYYLYYSGDDHAGFHGEVNTAGLELMDIDASTDFGCFSKLQLGWYRKSQVSVYDQTKGGEQTFTLTNAQTENGNCLILPYGELNYNGEYLILEYITPEKNNSSPIYEWMSSGNGIRAYHVKADIHDNGFWKHYKYENGSEFTNGNDTGIRLIRLVNDAEGSDVFTTGQILDGNISGWHWYDFEENETVDTGYTVTIGELKDGSYTITVNQTK